MADKTIISVIATCCDCYWGDEDYKTASKAAIQHANKTGHKVVVETTTSHTYNSKRIKQESEISQTEGYINIIRGKGNNK
jgi:hypothetical protein